MGAQLDQILAYLDREGVTEIMIGMGAPASLRRRGQLHQITNTAVTRGQINVLVGGTALARLIPEKDGVTPATDVQVGARTIRALVTRRGENIILRIEKSPPGAVVAPLEVEIDLDVPVAPPRAPSPRLVEPRAKPPSKVPATRGRGSTKAPASQARPRGMSKAVATKPHDIEIDLELPLGPQGRGRGASKAPATKPHDVAPAPRGRGSTKAPATPPADFDVALDLELPAAPPTRARGNTRAPRSTKAPGSRKGATKAPATRGHLAFGDLVRIARERNASDLHIATGRAIAIRVLGELVAIDPASPPCSQAEVDGLLLPLLGPGHQARLGEVGYVDLALPSPTGGRLRANVSRAQGGLKGTFRIARDEPATLDELGLPKELAKVINHHQGLVVIAGPSGHGKTTTLSALVDLVNATRPHHIITVEDPIEIVYPRKAAVVSQREVGPHTRSFASALKGSLREDPDVIVIGELRDRETVEIALTASETGHLVLATMSTPSAAKTIDRLVDMFPPEDQQQVRASIAGALRGIVSQRLLPRADGQGVVAAIELVTGVLPLAAMIRDDKLYQLPSLLQRGKAFGMIRMDDSLIDLVRASRITPETAIATSENKREIAATLKSGGGGTQAIPKLAEPATPQKTSRIAALFGGKKGTE